MNHNQTMMVRVFAFAVWALVAGTLGFWGLRSFVHPIEAPGNVTVVGDVAAMRGDLSALLGAPAAADIEPLATAPAQSARFRLVGVMAPKVGLPAGRTSPGLALIAVDGKPPKPYPVGTRVDGELLLRSVSLRTAVLGPAEGGAPFTLELPVAVAPARGNLPPLMPANAGFAPVPTAPPPQMAVPQEGQDGESERPPQVAPTEPRAGQVDRGALTR